VSAASVRRWPSLAVGAVTPRHRYYKQVLRDDPSNIFAANGMGMVLAEHGIQNQALDTFAQLKAAAGERVSDSTVNLAHSLVLVRRCLSAARRHAAGSLSAHRRAAATRP
jgi:hypothetical protein